MIQLRIDPYSAEEIKELRRALEKSSNYIYENFCKTNSAPCEHCKVKHVCTDVYLVLNYLKKKEKEIENESYIEQK